MEKELLLKGGAGVIATTVTYLFGGWSVALQILVYMLVFDYATGLLAAYFEKGLSSREGMKGIV